MNLLDEVILNTNNELIRRIRRNNINSMLTLPSILWRRASSLVTYSTPFS